MDQATTFPRVLAGATPIFLGFLAYVGLAILIYPSFYRLELYDIETEEGLTSFRIWFTASYVMQVILSLAVTILVAKLVRTSVRRTAVLFSILLFLLVIPTLLPLSYYNTCQNVPGPSPWGGEGCN